MYKWWDNVRKMHMIVVRRNNLKMSDLWIHYQQNNGHYKQSFSFRSELVPALLLKLTLQSRIWTQPVTLCQKDFWNFQLTHLLFSFWYIKWHKHGYFEWKFLLIPYYPYRIIALSTVTTFEHLLWKNYVALVHFCWKRRHWTLQKVCFMWIDPRITEI